jgi:hypothetical protein
MERALVGWRTALIMPTPQKQIDSQYLVGKAYFVAVHLHN